MQIIKSFNIQNTAFVQPGNEFEGLSNYETNLLPSPAFHLSIGAKRAYRGAGTNCSASYCVFSVKKTVQYGQFFLFQTRQESLEKFHSFTLHTDVVIWILIFFSQLKVFWKLKSMGSFET